MDSKTAASSKARSLEDILAEFGSIDQVIFEPVQLEPHKDAQALCQVSIIQSEGVAHSMVVQQ